MRAEQLPDDPPLPLEVAIRGWRSTPSFLEVESFAAWTPDGTIAGHGRVTFRRAEDNQHMVEIEIGVLPAFRRRGMGRALLGRLVEMPQRDGRRLILAWTCDRIPAGEAFMERMGATRGMVEKVSQLSLKELNHALLNEWLVRAPERASGFELGFWDGVYSDEDVGSVVELLHVMNDAPRQGLEIEDEQFTIEHMRAWERTMTERGMERWTAYVREKTTGKLAGYTDTFWSPYQPALLRQGGTGVWPQFRNKGIGRWVKAAMIERVLRERPQVTAIRTDNASTNAAMLNINYQLGFKPMMVNYAWQIETQKAVEYVRGGEG
jgi:GNAT superfamily N-acetyltransferase